MEKKLLVHICCAPDALYVVGLLKAELDPTGFFCNPNIFPAGEYEKRLMETRKVAGLLDFPLLEDGYEPGTWRAMTEKFKDEPEKGRRCDICYAMRLDRTARTAAERGFGAFSTVMTVSPWKKADVINRIGRMLGRRYGLEFVESDFKKKDGFKKSVELSRRHGIYRQDYCGCPKSLEDALRRRDKRAEAGSGAE